MIVLGIESSCDETGVALYDSENGLLGHLLHSQVDLHARYGGVVPEIASRDHVRKTLPLIEQVLAEADVQGGDIDAVAYTAGPGLIGALLVGANKLQRAMQVPAAFIVVFNGLVVIFVVSSEVWRRRRQRRRQTGAAIEATPESTQAHESEARP